MSATLFDVVDEPVTPVIELRDYQTEAIGFITEAESRGVRKQLGVAATGLGKGLQRGTPVLRSDGCWCPVEDLRVGDFVVGGDGQPTKVEGVFHRGEQPCFEVGMDDGVSVVVDADHLWTVFTDSDLSRGRPQRTINTAELHAQGVEMPSGRRRWRVPVVAPIEFDLQPELPIDAYILGVILGDGSITQRTVRFCPGDDWIAEKVESLLPEGFSLGTIASEQGATHYNIRDSGASRTTPNRMRSDLVALGLWDLSSLDKFIPEAYLTASVLDRRALLAGLMDCDGWVGKSTVEFNTSSPRLMADVKRLAESLGVVVRTGSKIPTYTHNGEKRLGARAYRLSFRGGGCPFTLPRKIERWRETDRWVATRKIRSITPVSSRETVCIKVSAEDGLFVIEHHIVTHNTIIFNSLAQQKGVRTLILAHRDELISQAVDKLLMMWPTADVGVIKAQRNEIDHTICVGSVQTLGRQSRLDQVPSDQFELIIVDEAHHVVADGYQRILEYFAPGDPLVLGVTATPDRGDGKGLGDTFDEIVFNYDMLWGIRRGFLSDIKGKRITMSGLDLSGVRVRRGDYAEGDVGRALEDADAPNQIAEAYLQYAIGRKTIVFTPTVAVADAVAIALRNRGVSAGMVSGETPLDERRQMLRDFKDGRITVLSNCQVLSEGYDEPSVDCIVVARPTRSRALYTQLVGRGTRRHPGKENCLVLDVVGASEEHNLITIPSLFGIEGVSEFEDKEKTVAGAIQEQVERQVKLGKLKAHEVEMFRRVIDSPLAWTGFVSLEGVRGHTISIGGDDNASVIIEELGRGSGGGNDRHADGDASGETPLTLWRTSVRSYSETDGQQTRVLISNVDLEMAQGVGEDYVRKHGHASFINRDAPWRMSDDPPSDKQIDYARRLGVDMTQEWTKGSISSAIDAAKMAKNLHKPDGGAGSNLATPKQIGYARSLGVAITPGLTKSEIGRLIDEAKKSR